MLLDRRKPSELEDNGRTIVFKYGKILYNLVVPKTLPGTPDYDDEVRSEVEGEWSTDIFFFLYLAAPRPRHARGCR